jgi:hypothetical protein
LTTGIWAKLLHLRNGKGLDVPNKMNALFLGVAASVYLKSSIISKTQK